ncbi:unnamed protein product [Nippostrongylus brasiliensis]|uniref:DUF4203 domain-containing protein n=1 Tax=Nippostrongylus brasiliensis TaxID=27835 RepID=A0A0N4Y8M0_NIPBR|nr:hypothetical protein Q1695_011025 [Nippostrongylus brasiliensis]VDL76173.1 unnamed protein product [Nippostrongylus brasiliensis]
MDTVADVCSTYRHDLEEAAEDLRRRGEALSRDAPKMIEDTRSQIEPQTQELIAAVQDTSNVSPKEQPMIEIYAWGTVMVVFSCIGIMLGMYLLGPLISAVAGKGAAAGIALFGIPFYAHYQIKQKGMTASDKSVRMEILYYAILQGVVTGFVIDSIYLTYVPYAPITPAVVACSFATVAKQANGNRQTLLGGTIGSAVLINLTLGMVTGSLSFVYFLLTLTYAGVAAIVMQVALKNLGTMGKPHVYQNALSCGIIAAKLMFCLLFGSYQPDQVPDKNDK